MRPDAKPSEQIIVSMVGGRIKPIQEKQNTRIADNLMDEWITDKSLLLLPEMQMFTQEICNTYDVPYFIMLAIMENESGLTWQPAKTDTNGLPSIGYTQINYPHWERLQNEYGVDVATEKGNIEGGIIILSELLEKYDLEKALVAYQCGETGAKDLESTEFSRKILSRSKELSQ